MDCEVCKFAEEIKEIKQSVKSIEKVIAGDVNDDGKKSVKARVNSLETKVKLFSKMFLLNIIAIIGGLVGTLWR